MEIKLSSKERKLVGSPDDVYAIMQRILLRENKIDQEKEHFWVIGMNLAGYLLYVELVSLGSVKETVVEPMNVFRIAVMKNASKIIMVHNHPSGILTPSDEDKELTDRLIQVGRILNITVADHLIITPNSYVSFEAMGLMAQLSLSIKYIPPYELVAKIRKEEREIAKKAVSLAKEIARKERLGRKKAEEENIEKEKMLQHKNKLLLSAVHFLLERELSAEHIAAILDISLDEVYSLIKTKK